MALVVQPTQLFHNPTAQNRDIPSSVGVNSYFERKWEDETSPSDYVFSVERGYHLNGGERTADAPYAIGIEPAGLTRLLCGLPMYNHRYIGGFATNRESEHMRLLLQVGALEVAENDTLPNLAPLDYATEAAALAAWELANFA